MLAIDEAKRERALVQRGEGNETEARDLHLASLLSDPVVGDVLEEVTARQLSSQYGDVFRAGKGAEAVRERLASLDLDALSASLRQAIALGGVVEKKAIKRLHVVEGFRASGVDPSWMILSVIPVLPPELRPLVPLDGGRFASSDLNVLYERVIYRNNRVKRFLELEAPEVKLNNEKRAMRSLIMATGTGPSRDLAGSR